MNPVMEWSGIVSELVPEPLVPFILALIQNESGGVPGISASLPTAKVIPLPTRAGKEVLADRALGLMQVIPANIEGYNEHNPGQQVYYEDMAGKDYQSGYVQIVVGLSIFWDAVKAMEQETGYSLFYGQDLNSDLLKLVLASYAWGSGRIRGKLNVLKDRGLNPTFENLKAEFPDLGKPENQPLVFVQRVFEKAKKYSGKVFEAMTPISTGAGISLAAGLVALFFWAIKRG